MLCQKNNVDFDKKSERALAGKGANLFEIIFVMRYKWIK
jgi:hypothetical protein